MKQIRVAWGDITKLPCDGIVSLSEIDSSGLIEPNGLISKLAGPELLEEYNEIEETNGIRVTEGYRLTAKYVIHTNWEYTEEFNEKVEGQLVRYYESIMNAAKMKCIKCLAIPTLKIGNSRDSLSEGIGMAVQSVCDWIKKNRCSMEVVFCAETRDEFELYQIFYPVCSWGNEHKFENIVMDVIEQIGNTKPLDTREKALAVVKDMLGKALKTKKEKVIQAYRRLEYEISTATDKEYDLLYNQCQRMIGEDSTVSSESFEIGAIRQAFKSDMNILTKDLVCEFFDIPEKEAKKILNDLVNMNYIKIRYFEGDLVVYSILISKEDFYLIHGEY